MIFVLMEALRQEGGGGGGRQPLRSNGSNVNLAGSCEIPKAYKKPANNLIARSNLSG